MDHLPFLVVHGAAAWCVALTLVVGAPGPAPMPENGFFDVVVLGHLREVKDPFLTAEACDLLVKKGAAFVGIDSLNIDDMADLVRPAHTILLGAGIPIVEHMCGLEQLPDTGFRFSAAPPKIKGMGTFPVRAYASLNA